MNTALALTPDAHVPEEDSSRPDAIRPRPKPHLRLIATHGRLLPDHQDNQTTVNYDNFGRRTSITNPDTGETTFTYDPASNLIEKATAKLKNDSQAIAYDYDFNRLVAIRYPVNTGNNVYYTYGAPTLAGDTNGNRAGRITKVVSHTTTTSQGDKQDTEERHYGKLGEVVYEKKTVVTFTDPLHPAVFETNYQFDTFGRLQKLTYPDGELLTTTSRPRPRPIT